MRLYNSYSRQVEEVVPIDDRIVRIYTCGPTVYRYAHVGNMRTYLLADLLRRALEFEGYKVDQIMNITDVGHMTDEASPGARDKMLLAMEDEGLEPLQIAEKYSKAFLEDAGALGIKPARVYPKATEHIGQMIELTKTLIDRGHAYEVDGSVYFDVASFPGYGKLSGNTLDKLKPGHRDLEVAPGKRSHADFSLWKAAGQGRLMKWSSPWGEGFPGWHIECSAMSMEYLGDHFDIHTGGNDLKFPHHEDEIAQSEGAVGHRVVDLWVHGGMMRLTGQKIAKSTGNVVLVRDLSAIGDPLAFRYLTFQTRYRREMDFTIDAFEAAIFKVHQLRRRMVEWADAVRPTELSPPALSFDRAFRSAVQNDLDMPQALVTLNEMVSSMHVPDGEKYALLASWDQVLGLDLERDARHGYEIPDEIMDQVRERERYRKDGDFATADNIRGHLREKGWEVTDGPQGPKVRKLD